MERALRRYLILTFIFSSLILLAGCNLQIEEFVPEDAVEGTVVPPIAITGANMIKLSPGSNLATGNQLKAKFSITTTERPLEGTRLKAKVSMSQSRVN